MGPSSSSPTGAQPPPIFGQCPLWPTAGLSMMLLGMEVGIGSGDFVFDGDTASSRKRAQPPPNFWPMSIVPKRLDGSRCHLVRKYTRPMPHCVIDGDPAPPPCERGTAVRPPLFDPCLLWLWATVATIDMGQEARGAGGRHGRLS